MLNINLVPEVKKEQAKVKKTNMAVTTVAVIVACVLVGVILLLGSLYGYRSARITSVNKDIAKIEGELKVYKELEDSVITLENGLREIKQILTGGRNWTVFYEEIEKATPSDIQLVSLNVAGNSITVDVRGKDVKSIDRFIKSFSTYKTKNGENMYANVVVNGYSTSGEGVSFQAAFDMVGESK